jgi:hypothetical protein
MTNVQDEHELVEHNKQNALSATIAAAVKYFPNGLMKRVAFGAMWPRSGYCPRLFIVCRAPLIHVRAALGACLGM